MFKHFRIDKDGIHLAERYQFYLAQQGQIFSGAMELLDNLIERGYELYAATNGITAIQTGRLAQSGLASYYQVLFSRAVETKATNRSVLCKNWNRCRLLGLVKKKL